MADEHVEIVPHANVYEAMAAAMAETGYVQKRGRISEGGNYTFAGERHIIEEVRPCMVRHGLFIYPSRVIAVEMDEYTTSRGNHMNLVTVTQEYVLAHSSGTFLTLQVVGAGADTGDKAAPKANTGAFKYAVRQSFALETGDDPDKDSSAEQERAAPRNTRSEPQPRQRRPQNASQTPTAAPSPAGLIEAELRERHITLSAVERVMGYTPENAEDAREWWTNNAATRLATMATEAEVPEPAMARDIIARAKRPAE